MSNPLAYVIVNRETMTVVNVILASPQFVKDADPTLGQIFVQTDAASIGQIYDEKTGEFTTPPEPPRYTTADEARTAIYDAIDAFTASVTGRVPVDEKASWIAKEDAARAFLADTESASQTALLSVEAHFTGEEVKDLALKIITKADEYRAVVATVTGIRRTAEIDLADQNLDHVVTAVMVQLEGLANGK